MTNALVLARKYRPQTFNDLIGQDALVQTVTNAIKQNRLPNAYMLTGIRGIGKTTSARIIAKGLNCIGADGLGGMTPNPCGICKNCRQITADSHIDVVEIDAASNTGVDDVREIIEGAKYNPVSARFKIYIIDEVHMLSKQAFNALLKTLEEPPERVKFIFATTEIRKVPVTILSRCQRFDLKRVEEEILSAHLQHIVEMEKAFAEPEALRLIARAGDGSVRDSLSLLDQALTQFDMSVKADDVRQMMGFSDKNALMDLYEALMKGAIEEALNLSQKQYQIGTDALTLVQDMLDLTHWLTRVKITPGLNNDIAVSETVRNRGGEMAQSLSVGTLSAFWEVLLKGLDEVRRADNPWQTLEMLLIRLVYLADLPAPAQLAEEIKKNTLISENESIEHIKKQPQNVISSVQANNFSDSSSSGLSANTLQQNTFSISPKEADGLSALSLKEENTSSNREVIKTVSKFQTFSDMVAYIKAAGDRMLAFNLENHMRVEAIDNFTITCSFLPKAPARLGAELISFLNTKANENWRLFLKDSVSSPTLNEKKETLKNQLLEELSHESVVEKALSLFPSAKINRVREIKPVLTEEEEHIYSMA